MTIDDDLDIRSFNRLKLQLRFAVFFFFLNEKKREKSIGFKTYPCGFFVEFDTSNTVETVQVEPSSPFGANSIQNET